jgi:tellurite resistance protein TehA-like permease
MGSASSRMGANSSGIGAFRTVSRPERGGRREDPASIGITFGADHRSRIPSSADDRRAHSSLSTPNRFAHIRRVRLETVGERRERPSLSAVVRGFTPNWFSVTMGTGALALALNQFPVPVAGMHDLAGGLWLLDILLFGLFTLIYRARWIFFFNEARQIERHAVLSMFFGAIPMGLATIINGFLIFGGGKLAVWIAHHLWRLDVTMSVACGLWVPFLMFTLQDHSMEKMTGVWLLPIVAAEVAAVSGALLVPHLSLPEAFAVLIFCYALWAFSVPVAMGILVILLLRLALHKLPEKDMAATSWLALGPIGTGALGLLLLGGAAPAVFGASGLHGIGEVAAGSVLSGGRCCGDTGPGGFCSR